jgi:hypothetical protein
MFTCLVCMYRFWVAAGGATGKEFFLVSFMCALVVKKEIYRWYPKIPRYIQQRRYNELCNDSPPDISVCLTELTIIPIQSISFRLNYYSTSIFSNGDFRYNIYELRNTKRVCVLQLIPRSKSSHSFLHSVE